MSFFPCGLSIAWRQRLCPSCSWLLPPQLIHWMNGWSINSFTCVGKYLGMNLLFCQIRSSEGRAIGTGSVVIWGKVLLHVLWYASERWESKQDWAWKFWKQCFNLRQKQKPVKTIDIKVQYNIKISYAKCATYGTPKNNVYICDQCWKCKYRGRILCVC